MSGGAFGAATYVLLNEIRDQSYSPRGIAASAASGAALGVVGSRMYALSGGGRWGYVAWNPGMRGLALASSSMVGAAEQGWRQVGYVFNTPTSEWDHLQGNFGANVLVVVPWEPPPGWFASPTTAPDFCSTYRLTAPMANLYCKSNVIDVAAMTFASFFDSRLGAQKTNISLSQTSDLQSVPAPNSAVLLALSAGILWRARRWKR